MITHNPTGTTPIAHLSESGYEMLLIHIGEQITAQIGADYPEGEAAKAACDALVNTFGIENYQTVDEWAIAACSIVGADWRSCVGV